MATLWKRANQRQYRMLRAIAGAVENTSHAHKLALPENFARGVAKRAVGTLTAQWPDVLASATVIWRQEQGRDTYVSRALRGSEVMESLAKGGRLRLLRRSPIRAIWYMYAKRMFKIRRQGTEEEYQTHCRILRLLDQAQRELDALTSQECPRSMTSANVSERLPQETGHE